MSHSEGNGEPGFAEEIFEVTKYEAASPQPERPFLPWHLPRKQYVRDTQWVSLAGGLVRAFRPDDGVLRYLGLPGSDLLDIRQLHGEVAQPNGLSLRFVGFNTAAANANPEQVGFNISLDEVKKLPGIDPRSVVLPDSFQLVGDLRSHAMAAVKDGGTFDIVNLDLCDGFCQAPPTAPNRTHYDAMATILGFQMRRTRPWVLLLTTRIDTDTVHEDVWPTLVEHYSRNLNDSEEFRLRSEELLQVTNSAEIDGVLADPGRHGKLVLTAICKWIASLSVEARSKLSVKSVIGYRVRPDSDAPDLVSVGMWIEPVVGPIQDGSGLSRAMPVVPDERPMAIRALEKVCAQMDADLELSNNEELLTATIHRAADLLQQARYDRGAYLEWIEQEHRRRGLVEAA